MLNTRENLLCSTIFDAKITTGHGNNLLVLPTLTSGLLRLRPALISEPNVFPCQKIESIHLVVANSLLAVNQFLDKDTAQVFASPQTLIVELTPAERAEMELRRNLSLLKAKDLKCVNLDWQHYVRSIWSNRCPKVDMVINKPH